MYTGFWWENLRERTRRRWEDIKIYIQEVRCGGMNWVDVAQERDRWRAVVNEVMNLSISQNAGNFLTS